MPTIHLAITDDPWGLDRDLEEMCAEARIEAERGAPVDPDIGSSAQTFGRATYVTYTTGVLKEEGATGECIAVAAPYTYETVMVAAREALRLTVAALRTSRMPGQTLYWRRTPDLAFALASDGLKVRATIRAVYQ